MSCGGDGSDTDSVGSVGSVGSVVPKRLSLWSPFGVAPVTDMMSNDFVVN